MRWSEKRAPCASAVVPIGRPSVIVSAGGDKTTVLGKSLSRKRPLTALAISPCPFSPARRTLTAEARTVLEGEVRHARDDSTIDRPDALDSAAAAGGRTQGPRLHQG